MSEDLQDEFMKTIACMEQIEEQQDKIHNKIIALQMKQSQFKKNNNTEQCEAVEIQISKLTNMQKELDTSLIDIQTHLNTQMNKNIPGSQPTIKKEMRSIKSIINDKNDAQILFNLSIFELKELYDLRILQERRGIASESDIRSDILKKEIDRRNQLYFT